MTNSDFFHYRISVHNLGYPETRNLLADEQQLENTHKGILLTATGLHKFLMSQDSRKDFFQEVMIEILIKSENGTLAQVHAFTPETIVSTGIPAGAMISPLTKVIFSTPKNYADARRILMEVLKELCGYYEVSDY